MTGTEFKKLLNSKFKAVTKEKGLTYFPSYSYAREVDSVLQIVSFNPGSNGFACIVAVQPLVVPDSDRIILNYSIALGHYAKLGFERWSYGSTKQETEQQIEECIKTLYKFGFPWLENVGSEKGIVSYHDDGTVICPPHIKNMYKGYCALHIGQIEKGVKWLEESIAYFQKLKYDYAEQKVKEMNEVINIAQNESNRLEGYLNGVVENSRIKLFTNQLRVM